MRIVVFDFDGTLVDSNAIKRDAFLSLAGSDSGGKERMTRLLKTVDGDRYAIWTAYCKEREGVDVAPSVVLGAVQAFNTVVNAAIVTAPEMPGADELLNHLRDAGVHLAVSSATPYADLIQVLEQRGWFNRFDTIAGSPAKKVETLIGLMATHRIGVDQLVVVGDGEDDRASALAIGCTYYPVGEARGMVPGDRVYTLYELGNLIDARPVGVTHECI